MYKLMIIALLCLVMATNCYFQFKESMSVSIQDLIEIKQCGYNDYPLISLKNGTVNIWDRPAINLNTSQSINCFKSAEQLDQSIRFVSTSSSQLEKNPFYLSRSKHNQIQVINWMPELEPDQQVIYIRHSPNLIAFLIKHKQQNSSIKVYRNSDLSLFAQLPHSSGFQIIQFFIDNYENLLIVTEDGTISILYGAKYQKQYKFKIPKFQTYTFISDVSTYYSGYRNSKFMLHYNYGLDMSRTQMQILYQGSGPFSPQLRQAQGQIVRQQKIQVKLSNTQTFTVLNQKINCEDEQFVISFQDGCIINQGSCVVKKYPQFMTCSREHSSSIDSLNRIKLVLGFVDESYSNMTIQLYEQVKIVPIVFISVIIFLLAMIVIAAILLILRSKQIYLSDYILCRVCRQRDDQDLLSGEPTEYQ